MLTIAKRFRGVGRASIFLAAGVAALLFAPLAPADVIFQDDFETCNFSRSTNGFSWTDRVQTFVNTNHPRGGNCALEFVYPAAPIDPSDRDRTSSFSEQRFALGGHYPDLWVKYDLFVPADYYHRTHMHPNNNKGFVYLWSGDYGNPSGPGMGASFWASGQGESSGSHTVWYPIDRHWWPDDPVWSDIVFKQSDRGKWMEVIMHYRYATAANNDGIARIWITSQGENRRQVLNLTTGNWYVAGAQGFSVGYLLGWANSGFDQETRFYIDNIVFSTDPIGMDPPAAPVASVR